MRPSSPPKAVEFLAFHNLQELEEVKRFYPGGIEESFFYDYGRSKMVTYTVSAKQIAETFNQALVTGIILDKDYYSLTPTS